MQLTRKQINYCMECGVCTGSCPVSRTMPGFSPRQFIKRALMDEDENLFQSRELWACLTCARCSVRCPAEIDFPEFNRSYRAKARRAGNLPRESHHGIMQAIAGLQTFDVRQDRTRWARAAGRFVDRGEVFYFVGCLPYFDVVFRYLDLSPITSAVSALKLLNRMGIEPVISNDERCCGHDALWSGDEETFIRLARANVDLIRSSGAKKVVFTCPEGYVTFKERYPEHLGPLPFETLHMTEFLAAELPGSGLRFHPSDNGSLTFQDPCRLGRLAGIYEPPRELLKAIPDTSLVEMERNRENALCCGTSAWMECSGCSKAMQVERIEEAVRTGANTLITACPKCQIHLTCAQSNTGLSMEVKDLYTYLEQSLQEQGGPEA